MTITQGLLGYYEGLINSNNTNAIADYYQYLADNGIVYGDLAKQVGTTGYYGDVAEIYFENKVQELHPDLTAAQRQQKFNEIRKDLALEDILARETSLADNRGGEISYNDIYDYHVDVYTDKQISADAWTGKAFDDIFGGYGNYMDGLDPNINLGPFDIIAALDEYLSRNGNTDVPNQSWGNMIDALDAAADAIYDPNNSFVQTLENAYNAMASGISSFTYLDEFASMMNELVSAAANALPNIDTDWPFSDWSFDLNDWLNDAINAAEDLLDSAAIFLQDLVSPLILDLDGDGIELSSLVNSTAFFDLDADGFHEHTGWVSADDGILAIDSNGNGVIDGIDEVFGNATTDGFVEPGVFIAANDNKVSDSIKLFIVA
jgi:hypothetical protein